MKKQDIKALNSSQLLEKQDQVRRELFSLRLNAKTAHIKDYSQFKKKRKTLARLLTYYGQQMAQGAADKASF